VLAGLWVARAARNVDDRAHARPVVNLPRPRPWPRAGAITDTGVLTVDCSGKRGAKPASIYAEMIVEGRIDEVGVVCPEELPRRVRDAFLAECGRRGIRVTRSETVTVN